MNRDELRERINALNIEDMARSYGLDRDKSGKGWKCINPDCNSGSGNGKHGNGTGMSVDREHNKLHCFACGKFYDVLDVIQATHGTDYPGALSIGASELRLTLEPLTSTGIQRPTTVVSAKPKAPKRTQDGGAFEDATDYPASFGPTTLNHATAAAYLKRRQIPADTAARLGVRYDAAKNAVIVPTGGDSYSYRPMYSKPGEKSKTLHVAKEKGGRVLPFNARALLGPGPVAIVEGWENAASFEAVSCPAVAIHGATMTGKLLNALDYMQERGDTIPTLILALDADKAGRDATDTLTAALDERGIRCVDAGPMLYGESLPHDTGTDPNDLLRADKDGFRAAILTARKLASADVQAEPEEDAKRDRLTQTVQKICNAGYMVEFTTRLQSRRNSAVPTGLSNLDAILHGGIRPGLTIMGGATGTGKTMLVLQIADEIAMSGRPVLYAALEMGRDELIARSVSRLSADVELVHGIPGTIDHLSLLDGKSNAASGYAMIDYFRQIAPNMYHFTLDDAGLMTVRDIREIAQTIAEMRGTAPIVFVDYLQLLAPESDRMTDKQAADRNVWALKQLARRLDTPVFAISSFNRASYKAGDNVSDVEGQAAYKESGGIEYTAEVLLNLYRGMQIGDAQKMTMRMVKARALPIPPEPIAFFYRGQVSMFTPDITGQARR